MVAAHSLPFQDVNAGHTGTAAPADAPVVGAHHVPFQEVAGPQDEAPELDPELSTTGAIQAV
ncbi:MAG: hypothetical protein WCJ91_05525 [Actinomycetes bacterium]